MLMMMMMPHLTQQEGDSSQNPMSGLLLASMMKKMTSASSESSSDYSYDYGYDYSYDYEYDYSYDYSYDYEYDYSYDYDYGSGDYGYQAGGSASSSSLSSIMQQMLQQKLAAAHTPSVQVTMEPTVSAHPAIADSNDSNPDVPLPKPTSQVSKPSNVEIAPVRPHADKEIRPSEQVSYRNAP